MGNKTIADNKMAAVNLATELMETLTPDPYNEHVSALMTESAMSSKVMQTLKTTLKGKYKFNSDVFRARNGMPKPTGMLDLFGQYSGDEANDIRKEMIKFARENKATLMVACKDALTYKEMSFDAWITKLSLRKSVCDEIALYVLCKLYSRHAIVYTAKNIWTTLKHTGLTGSEIERKCDLMLYHTEKGLVLCKKLTDSGEDEDGNGTPRNVRKKVK